MSRKFDSSSPERNSATLATIMSPRVTRRSTGVGNLHQRQYDQNSRNVNEPKPQASAEMPQKESKSKPRKLIIIKKKPNQKPPVVDPIHSDVTSSADEMPLNKRLFAKKKIFVKKTAANNTAGQGSPIFKRPMPSIINIQHSKQTTPKGIHPLSSIINQKVIQNSSHSTPKKARNKEDVCKELFAKCNKQTLLKMMVKEFDGEEILKGYKEKRNTWDKKNIQEEAARVLDISLENQSTSKDAKMTSLQKVLKELSNLVESSDEFAEMVLKTYSRQLKAEKIFQLLELDDLKRAILEKFTANDMLDFFSKTTDYSSVVRQILEMASVDAIVDILKSRNNLETSQKLLKVSLEILSEITPDSIEQTRNGPSLTSNLQSGLTDAIVNTINSKKFLKTSESLLNFMLQNVIEIQSKKTKKNFLDFLINKFNSDERADISHEVIKSILNQNKKGIAMIDISN